MMRSNEFFIGGYHTEEVNVRCPRCSGLAMLDIPWELYSVFNITPPSDNKIDFESKGYTYIERGDKGARWVLIYHYPRPDLEGRYYYLSGQTLVIEKYPNLIRRKSLQKDWDWDRGPYVIKCSKCHLVDTYLLDWPRDAYFQWSIRGHTLWAFSYAHAQALLKFIASDERDETQFGYHGRYLRKLPTHFITAKVRDLIVKKISPTLEQS